MITYQEANKTHRVKDIDGHWKDIICLFLEKRIFLLFHPLCQSQNPHPLLKRAAMWQLLGWSSPTLESELEADGTLKDFLFVAARLAFYPVMIPKWKKFIAQSKTLGK